MLGRLVERVMAVAAVGTLLATAGCGSFFTCEGKTSCGSSSGGTDSGNVVFAGNQNSTGIYAYYLSSGKLYTVAGEPFTTSFVPSAMAVNTANTYLFVAATNGYIYDYAVSSAGVLSSLAQEASNTLAQVSMDVSSDGKWLASLDGGTTIPSLKIYSISGATLTLIASTQLQNATVTITPMQVKFSPDNTYLAVALQAGGEVIYPFTTSSATAPIGSTSYALSTGSTTSGDNAIAWDSSNNLYIARSTASASTTGIYVAKASTFASGPVANFAVTTDSGAKSLAFASSYKYLYAASTSNNTINGYSVSNGALTSLGTSTTAPTGVTAMAVDTSGLNLLAAGTSSTGLQLYTESSGALSQSNNAATGTASGYPVLAVTH